MQQLIMMASPKAKKQIGYEKRLALSIFTGQPVDPSMNPAVMRVLQGAFMAEPGSNFGTQQPRPQPAFGSVKKPDATQAQQRAGK